MITPDDDARPRQPPPAKAIDDARHCGHGAATGARRLGVAAGDTYARFRPMKQAVLSSPRQRRPQCTPFQAVSVVVSLIVAVGPLVRTDAMPVSRDAAA